MARLDKKNIPAILFTYVVTLAPEIDRATDAAYLDTVPATFTYSPEHSRISRRFPTPQAALDALNRQWAAEFASSTGYPRTRFVGSALRPNPGDPIYNGEHVRHRYAVVTTTYRDDGTPPSRTYHADGLGSVISVTGRCPEDAGFAFRTRPSPDGTGLIAWCERAPATMPPARPSSGSVQSRRAD